MTAVQQWWFGGPVAAGTGPRLVLSEDFEAGIGDWTILMGTAFLSAAATAYGTSLFGDAVTSGGSYDWRRKTYIPGGDTFNHFRVRGMLPDTGGNDDGPTIYAIDTANNPVLTVILARESSFDSARRPRIALGSDALYAGTTRLTAGEWYWFDIYVIPGAGNSTWSVTRCSDDVVWASGTFPSDHGASKAVGGLAAYAEASAGFTSQRGYFDDVSLYFQP